VLQLTEAQHAEIKKYASAYRHPHYRMSDPRRHACVQTLAEVPWRESYLDVACGRGEMLAAARECGFARVQGTEVVPALLGGDVVAAFAWALPFSDQTFDVVSMFDVIEHLLPGDDARACAELARVARRTILLTANNLSSRDGEVELHINRRPYDEWDELFRLWFPTCRVTWLRHRRAKLSEMWRIDLDSRRQAARDRAGVVSPWPW
jgi:SAM-dependent methyltransferase